MFFHLKQLHDCTLPQKYENSQFRICSSIPQALSFSSSDQWGTKSKALRKSKKIAQIYLPLSIDCSHLCVASNSAEIVDLLDGIPTVAVLVAWKILCVSRCVYTDAFPMG